jgi:hypothetical protein
VAEVDTEACEFRQGVDDEPTAVAGVVIALVGILVSESAVDPDRVSDPFVLSPSVGLARFRVRVR